MDREIHRALVRYMDESAGAGSSVPAHLACARRAFLALPGVEAVSFFYVKPGQAVQCYSFSMDKWLKDDRLPAGFSVGSGLQQLAENEWCLSFASGAQAQIVVLVQVKAMGAVLSAAIEQMCSIFALRMEGVDQEAQTQNSVHVDGLALLAHEFKSPLGIALSSSNLLQEMMRKQLQPDEFDAKYKKYFMYVDRSLHRVLRLADNVVDAQYGFLSDAPEWTFCDIATVLQELGEGVQPYVQNGGATLAVYTEGSLKTMCDTVYLDRILLNLISNAVKYSVSAQHGHIELRAWERDEKICISVQDDGPGVAPEDLPHVFDKFWRSGTGAGKQGTGLGLYIVHELTTALEGTIRAECVETGGLRFVVELPKKGQAGRANILEGRPVVYDHRQRAMRFRVELSDIEPCLPAEK